MKDVLNKGTGAAVRARGFTLPAAGKTGTRATAGLPDSRRICHRNLDRFDDNRDIGLTGGATAAPVWRVHEEATPAATPVKDFDQPMACSPWSSTGIRRISYSQLPTTREEVYVSGSAPTEYCEFMAATDHLLGRFLAVHIFGVTSETAERFGEFRSIPHQRCLHGLGQTVSAGPDARPPRKRKKPFTESIGIFGGKKKDSDSHKSRGEGESP